MGGLDITRQGAIAEKEWAKTFYDWGWYVEKWPTNPGGFDFLVFNVEDYNNRWGIPIGCVMAVEIKANPTDISQVQKCAREIIEKKYGPKYGIKYHVAFFNMKGVPVKGMQYTLKNYKLDYAMYQDMRNKLYGWKTLFEKIRLDIKKYCKKH